MWLFSPSYFLSAVRDNNRDGFMRVRFRHPDHAQRCMDDLYTSRPQDRPDIEVTPAADYRWKVSIPSEDFVRLVTMCAVDAGNYSNFKNECHDRHPDDPTPHLEVWTLMHRVQQDATFLDHVRREDRAPLQTPTTPAERQIAREQWEAWGNGDGPYPSWKKPRGPLPKRPPAETVTVYRITADHPTFARVDETVKGEEACGNLLSELRSLNYDNIASQEIEAPTVDQERTLRAAAKRKRNHLPTSHYTP